MSKDFDKELQVMKMYTSNAGLYIKLSSAALALTVTFPEKILKVCRPMVDLHVILIWIGFLLAIGTGAFYHYLAGKYMEKLLPEGAGFRWLNWIADRCGIVYGLMLLSFYASAVLFTCNAISAVSR